MKTSEVKRYVIDRLPCTTSGIMDVFERLGYKVKAVQALINTVKEPTLLVIVLRLDTKVAYSPFKARAWLTQNSYRIVKVATDNTFGTTTWWAYPPHFIKHH